MDFDDGTMTAAPFVAQDLHAIILAAGIGRRLGLQAADGEPKPKILLDFEGRSLLSRHVFLLEQGGVGSLTIVLGYGAELVESALAELDTDLNVTTVENPDYCEGSVVSLWAARDMLRCTRPIVLMDADVLYDRRMIARLVQSRHAEALLLDRNIEPGDEPVKICVRDGVIVDFRKNPTEPHDWHGESVGFFRFSPEAACELADRVDSYVGLGRRSQEYEEAIRDMIQASNPHRFGFEDISALPWTEIDFPDDVIKAHALLPDLAP
jgi:choline kinase